MPPKTRNGEKSSKAPSKAPSLPPALPKKLPPIPRQRRSGARSGATSTEGPLTQTGSSSKEVTAPSRQNVHPSERPQQSVPLQERTRRDDTPMPTKSQSHHRADTDGDDDPLLTDIRAQNLVIQEQKELISQLQQQLREKNKAPVPPPRCG